MKSLYLGAALLLLTAGFAHAEDPVRMSGASVTGEVGAMTDYRVRGISRSGDHPALQGRIQLNHPLGIYGGAQATTVDLNSDDDANVETQLYGGYKGQYAGVDYDAKLSWTGYPGGDNDDEDYWEFTARGGYDFGPAYASLTWAASPDYINSSGMSLYYGGDVAVPVSQQFTLNGHLGFQFVDDEGPYVNSDTMDWGGGVTYNYTPYDVDIGLQYADTDLDKDECVEKCGAQLVLKASKDFSW